MIGTATSLSINGTELSQSKRVKDIVYEYGFTNILKLKHETSKQAIELYQEARKGGDQKKFSKDLRKVIQAIQKGSWGINSEERIKNELPSTLTAFFNRTIAKALEEDQASTKEMLKVLSAENYWQLHLDKNKFLKGEVYFLVLNSGASRLEMIGSMAAITDITSGQGMINYKLHIKRAG
jgi:hypothetical protein